MTKATQLSVNIPFPGFYESTLSWAVDNEEEQFAEYETGPDCTQYERDRGEGPFPPELRLSAREYGEILFKVTDYRIAYNALAREYVEAFSHCAAETLGFPLPLTFEEMTSPREYNFTTDRVFCLVPLKTIRALFSLAKADKFTTLERAIKARFTSRDGFISSYSNRLAEWLEKPLREWDHNELGTLLIAAIELQGGDESDFEREVIDRTLEGEGAYRAWESAVDWPAFEKGRDELRAEKEAELRADDPDYIPPPVRCTLTIDMFTGRAG